MSLIGVSTTGVSTAGVSTTGVSTAGGSTAGVSTIGVSTAGVSTAGDDTIVGLTVCWVVSFVDEPPQAINKKIKVIGVIKLIFLLIGNFLEFKRA
jgi:hypothetical protein